MNPPSDNFGAAGDVDPKGRARSPSAPYLDRLLRSAAQADDNVALEAPFGFDTRVVALWRAGSLSGNHGLARFVQRVAAISVVAIIVSAAAVLYEVKQARESSELDANEFAIADSAIELEFPQ